MTKLLLTFASLVAVATLAHSQEAGVQFRGQAMRASTDGSTLRCTKCVIPLNQKDVVQISASRISVDGAGTVTLQGAVRLKFVGGEVVAESGTITTDENGVRHFNSDELQFVGSSIR
jgi:hypothetical protein